MHQSGESVPVGKRNQVKIKKKKLKDRKIHWGRLKDYKGTDSEDTIRNLLGIFKVQKLILGYTRPKRHSIPEHNGVDFWVEFLSSDMKIKSFPLQVKSSWQGFTEHKRKYNHPCIIASPQSEKLLKKLIQRHCPPGC